MQVTRCTTQQRLHYHSQLQQPLQTQSHSLQTPSDVSVEFTRSAPHNDSHPAAPMSFPALTQSQQSTTCKPLDTQRNSGCTTTHSFSNHRKCNHTHLRHPATSVSSSHAVRRTATRIQPRRSCYLLSHIHSSPRRCKPLDTQRNSSCTATHSFSNHHKHNRTHIRHPATSVSSSHAVHRSTTRIQRRRCCCLLSHNHSNHGAASSPRRALFAKPSPPVKHLLLIMSEARVVLWCNASDRARHAASPNRFALWSKAALGRRPTMDEAIPGGNNDIETYQNATAKVVPNSASCTSCSSAARRPLAERRRRQGHPAKPRVLTAPRTHTQQRSSIPHQFITP
jgi:hypothetical protein